MFNKLKQYNDLRKQANVIKNAMASETIEVSNSEDFLSKDKKNDLEKEIQSAVAEAIKKVQRKMAMKMQEMGGLDNLLK